VVSFVDEFDSHNQYPGRMRRFWLTLLTAFALAASGVSAAFAAQDCPMGQTEPVRASAHDCCPENSQPEQNQSKQHNMDGCMMGMTCRTAPALAPTVAPVSLSNATILLSQPITCEPAKQSGPLQELFRPPRTI
jgi:hypothetical protein